MAPIKGVMGMIGKVSGTAAGSFGDAFTGAKAGAFVGTLFGLGGTAIGTLADGAGAIAMALMADDPLVPFTTPTAPLTIGDPQT